MNIRLALTSLVVGFVTAALLSARSASHQPAPAFDVASVKRNTSNDLNSRFDVEPGGLVVIVNTPLRSIIRNAYLTKMEQVEGGPRWLDSERYDINARAAGPASVEQVAAMLRALLVERFKLVARVEPREMAVFALTLAHRDGRLGQQLRPAAVDCAAVRAGKEQAPARADGRPACRGRGSSGFISAGGVTMTEVAQNISRHAGRFVVDRTGLTGFYDLEVKWTPEPPLTASSGTDDLREGGGPSFQTALEEQLGLKLEPLRAPIDFLVIQSVERPTGN